MGEESLASSCLRKGTPLASRVVRGFQAPGRAVCGTRGIATVIPDGSERVGIQATSLLLSCFISALFPPALIWWHDGFAPGTGVRSQHSVSIRPWVEQGPSQECGLRNRSSGLRHSTPQDVGCQSLSFPHLEIGGISSVQFSCLVVSDSLQPHESHNSWGCNDDQRKKLGRA